MDHPHITLTPPVCSDQRGESWVKTTFQNKEYYLGERRGESSGESKNTAVKYKHKNHAKTGFEKRVVKFAGKAKLLTGKRRTRGQQERHEKYQCSDDRRKKQTRGHDISITGKGEWRKEV